MIRIGLIGGGSHSRINHLTALLDYSRNIGGIELAAFCDLDPAVRETVARQYPFHSCYADFRQMLERERLDGCIAITPLEATLEVSKFIMSEGVPLLMEKPPGRTLSEAGEIREHASRTGAIVQVSMNRRFDPAIVAADALRATRPLKHIRAEQLRSGRCEPDFICSTGIHVVDTLRYLGGEVLNTEVRARDVEGVLWLQVQLEFQNGALGELDVFPTCGRVGEAYALSGPDYYIRTGTGEPGGGVVEVWEGGRQIHADEPARGLALHIRNGSYAETCAFVDVLKGDRTPWPSLDDVWPTVELCHRIHREASLAVAT